MWACMAGKPALTARIKTGSLDGIRAYHGVKDQRVVMCGNFEDTGVIAVTYRRHEPGECWVLERGIALAAPVRDLWRMRVKPAERASRSKSFPVGWAERALQTADAM